MWDFPPSKPLVTKTAAVGLLRQRLGLGRNFKQMEEVRAGRVRKKPCRYHKRQIPDAGINFTVKATTVWQYTQ